jgi:diguanylate cyclase (GGDEF)-like protein
VEARRSARIGAPLSVVMLDIDHFKLVNDGFGHAAGDEEQRHVALLLVRNVRSYELVARWGGEEFLLLLPEASPSAAATRSCSAT